MTINTFTKVTKKEEISGVVLGDFLKIEKLNSVENCLEQPRYFITFEAEDKLSTFEVEEKFLYSFLLATINLFGDKYGDI